MIAILTQADYSHHWRQVSKYIVVCTYMHLCSENINVLCQLAQRSFLYVCCQAAEMFDLCALGLLWLVDKNKVSAVTSLSSSMACISRSSVYIYVG